MGDWQTVIFFTRLFLGRAIWYVPLTPLTEFNVIIGLQTVLKPGIFTTIRVVFRLRALIHSKVVVI